MPEVSTVIFAEAREPQQPTAPYEKTWQVLETCQVIFGAHTEAEPKE